MDPLFSKIFIYVIIILSATFHEFAHGWMAHRLGDDTAKDQGRLTLNPLAHIDPLGTVVIPLILMFTAGIFIGWAKPVPYNPYNLRDQKYGSLKVGFAGPAANIVIVLILGLALRFFPIGLYAASGAFIFFLGMIVYINIFLALFNLIPVPPLDGSKILFDLFPAQRHLLQSIGFIGLFIALLIAIRVLPAVGGFVFRAITGFSLF